VKSVARGAQLRFWISEPATVEVTVRRKGRAVTATTVHAPAGNRTVLLRSTHLRKRGTYTIQWRAADAMANKSAVLSKTLRVK
jgi:hypothetical protein